MKRAWCLAPCALLALLAPMRAHAAPPGEDGLVLRAAALALTELRVEDARDALGRLVLAYPRDSDVLAQFAMLRFHQGEYAVAAAVLERALSLDPAAPDVAERRAMLALLTGTRDTMRDFVETRSADGRYVVRHAPGPDRILVPYALELLRAGDDALFAELGVRVPGPVRLEIYASPRVLSRVSSLSVEEIERTGTIALCKWDRLMITSPRALVRGYPWADTVAHELVHLVLARATRDHAPVWFQEGMAKLFERRWRGDVTEAHLEPAARTLLYRAFRDDHLLPFDRLHPSIARLPSQEDAALAFAQVATFVEVYRRTHRALRPAIARMAGGEDAREALAAEAGEPFEALEAEWKADLRARPVPPDTSALRLRFRHAEGAADESLDVSVEAARRALRLGDLLWGRQRAGAASIEYAAAAEAAPDDPIVASRLGRAALAAGQPARALAALTHVVALHPDHAPTQALLGAALVADGRPAEAREPLREALRINPFDPDPHCHLAECAESEAERVREAQMCRDLRR